MSEIAISVQGIGKRYRLGIPEAGYKTIRETIMETLRAPFRRRKHGPARESERLGQPLWALKEICFELKKGEVVGIIGRNGAGKSTLLKILSRITAPTEGRVKLYGRIGSLLEVGTGFHPELTGRENVFLNGAILGMRREEIGRKFDEIVAFAEVEKFLDTPVKHYSSGMYVRLAFAVAAHLDPEILLVDEVLAVGDTSFQKKCLNRMQDIGQEGRTVLFVSHNMPAITRLCPRTLLLENGRIARDDLSPRVVSAYLGSGLGTRAAREWRDLEHSPGNEIVRLRGIRVKSEDGRITDAVDIRKPVAIEMEYEVLQPNFVLVPNYHFFNEEGVYVFISGDPDPTGRRVPKAPGSYVSTAWIPGNFLAEGGMIVGAAVSTMDPARTHFWERDAVSFQVVDSREGDSARGDYGGPMPGVVRPMLRWVTDYKPYQEKKDPSAVERERQ